jgi:hypothetical protein
MRVHDFFGKLGLVVVNLEPRTQLRKHDRNDNGKESGHSCHPVPKQRFDAGVFTRSPSPHLPGPPKKISTVFAAPFRQYKTVSL